ncbi:MAG: hypothetical protein LBB98_04165 [Treponema sp.]|jgi:hypothetical protein|nr:hypothetical protein [Treponema sp.]
MIRRALCIAFIFFVPYWAGSEEKQAGTPSAASQNGLEQSSGAEGEEAEEPGAADFFPVLSLYRTALSGEVSWRPDWPLSIPPDAFSFPPQGGSTLTLIVSDSDLAAEMTVRRNDDGLLAEFPLFRDGGFFQVQTRFGGAGFIRGFAIAPQTPGQETSWDILIVEYEDALPSLARITRGETLYFAVIEYKAAEALEIWYDQDGNALAVFSYRHEAPGGRIRRFTGTDLLSGEEFAETYHYDSMGNISGIVASSGEYAALYAGKGRPRYWERIVSSGSETPQAGIPPDVGQPAAVDTLPGAPEQAPAPGFDHFSFQWDEEGFLVRFTGGSRREAVAAQDTGDETEMDIRYEYVRDEQGVWIERRDTPMIRRAGFLVPGPVGRLSRRIEYPAP